jgi:murein L,D-transpeptidase YcbB/YkuD
VRRPRVPTDPLRAWTVLCLAVGSIALARAGVVAQEEGRPEGAALPEATDPVVRTIQRVVMDAVHPELRWPRFPFYRDELEGIYRDRDWALLWVESGRTLPAADDALHVLATADSRGLDPADYDAATLRELATRLDAGELSRPEQALFDTGLTVAILRLLSDLHIGRVNPANLHFGYDIEPKKLDLVRVLVDAVARDRVGETVSSVEPRLAQYDALTRALAAYRRMAATLDPATLPDPGATVHPDEAYAGAAELAGLLERFGDLPPGAAAGRAGTLDSTLVEGLRAFQNRHGLEPDGVLGPRTLEELRTPLTARVRQIELALERVRWLPEPTGRRFVIVNIPAFELWAFDGNPNVAPTVVMRVVVGRALRTQTPVFQEEMKYVVFSPYWNIPWNITINEVLPHMRADPGYLSSHGMEALPAAGGSATQAISPALIESVASGAYRVRQRPGPANALGRVKFIFPNASNVYLHDTPSVGGFSVARRDFSHGCIRLADPTRLAEWVLATRPEWGAGEIQRAMSLDRETRVDLRESIPVLIFYSTAVVEPDGRIAFRDDIYGHDAVLERTLAAGYPYAP